MTALDVLESRNSEFLAFCERWQREGRALLPFADWFRERGMDDQADAWEWAAKEPDRNSGGDVGGVRPYELYKSFYWNPEWQTQSSPYRSDIPRPMCWGMLEFHSNAGAIAWFLDRWAAVFGGDMPANTHAGSLETQGVWAEFQDWTAPYCRWPNPPPPPQDPAPMMPERFSTLDFREIKGVLVDPHTR